MTLNGAGCEYVSELFETCLHSHAHIDERILLSGKRQHRPIYLNTNVLTGARIMPTVLLAKNAIYCASASSTISSYADEKSEMRTLSRITVLVSILRFPVSSRSCKNKCRKSRLTKSCKARS